MVRVDQGEFVTKDLLADVSRVTRLSVIWGGVGILSFIPTLVGVSLLYQQPYGTVSQELYWVLFGFEVWLALGFSTEMRQSLADTKAMVDRDDVTLEEGETAEQALEGMKWSMGAFLLLGLALLGMQLFRIGVSEMNIGLSILVGLELFALVTSYLFSTWSGWALEAIALSTREELARKGIDVQPRRTWRDVKLPSC